MFQLNPWKRWSINKRIFKNQISLNKELGIWTSEPKFTQIYNINAKREYL